MRKSLLLKSLVFLGLKYLSLLFTSTYKFQGLLLRQTPRYEHAKDQYNKAITWCDRAADATGCETKRKYVDNALEELGKGLHPLQDWVAHGSWKPFPTALHIWPFHPTGTDDHNLDFRHHPSGILRDWDYFGIFGGLLARPLFIPGNKRLTLTKKRTVDYLDSFKDECSITCKCQIYSVLHGRK